ncbi:MAG TPA: BON domain-containing protein [Bryobacteraceae bacterium]|nr:BON domain-containing protein [Bryobacteraceae bacterium]
MKLSRVCGALTMGVFLAGSVAAGASDRELKRSIEAAIQKDPSLSTAARRIKVISQRGKVTLRGSVPTEAERETIQAKATEIAGATNLASEISIKSAAAGSARTRSGKLRKRKP